MSRGLHKMVEEDVGELLKGGHVLSLSDIPDVLAMNDLAWRYTDMSIDECGDILAIPKRMGNVMLYPLTLGVGLWIDECVLPWFEKDPLLANMAIAYGLSVAREPAPLRALATRKDCLVTIKEFWRNCGCGIKELEQALLRLLPGEESEEAPGKPGVDVGNYGAVVAVLCELYGHDPNHWLWYTPVSHVMALLDRAELKTRAEYKVAKASAGKGVRVPMPECLKSRFAAYVKKMREVKRKWLAT